MFSWSLLLLLLHSFSTFVSGLQVGYTLPTQCDQMTVRWADGNPPYELLLVPAFNTARKIPVSSSSSNGSTSFQLGLAAGQQFLLTMSDATGFASGGVSALLTVGPSISHANCSTAVPPLKFEFTLGGPLEQCGSLDFSDYGGATQPINITGFLPSEAPIQLYPPSGSSSFLWNPVNLSANDQVIFLVTDAHGDFGGTSHLLSVQSTSNQACLNDGPPHSDATTPTPIPFGGTNPTGAPQATVTVTPKASNAGTIGGAIAGTLVTILLLGTLIIFLYRQRKMKQTRDRRISNRSYIDGPASSTNLTHSPAPWDASTEYTAEPFRRSAISVPPFEPSSTAPSFVSDHLYTPNPWSAPSNISNAQPTQTAQPQTSTSSKSHLGAPSNRPTRFILHTDAEIDQDVEEIELPPQYSDRFEPPPRS